MTEPQDQFATLVNHSQQAATTAITRWADTVRSFAGRAGRGELPDLSRAVDQYFSFAEQVLADQRQLAQQWASATVMASAAVTEQAQRAARSVSDHSAEAVVDKTAETARVAAHTVAITPSVNDDSGS